MYKCSECHLAVIIVSETEIIRACEHVDASIIAEMSAQMEGVGGAAA